MALLRIAALVALAGCYEPTTKSCTVACSMGDSCADGQSCVAGFCVDDGAPACSATMEVDAPASQTTSIMIQISGHGQIVFGQGVVCDSESSGLRLGPGTCSVPVPQHIAIHATAIPTDGNEFQSWGAGPCPAMTTTCDFTPDTPTMMLAPHFK